MKSILDIEISCFQNYSIPSDPKTVNLLNWLTSTKYKKEVDLIRSTDDKSIRDVLKSKLPGITPSGLFTYRSQTKLVRHSGFIQIDIDQSKLNLEISNWNELKTELSKLPNIAYLGLSVSGKGFWGLIPIPPDPENHKLYFDNLYKIFLGWGIELDNKPKSTASLRGFSYDEAGYFNHQAVQFTKMAQTYTVQKIIPQAIKTSKSDRDFAWLENWILSKISQSMPGDRHDYRLKYSRLAGGLIAGGYLTRSVEESIINNYLLQYEGHDAEDVQKKEIQAIRDGIKHGMITPTEPPPIKCLFVAFTDIKDYSERAFKIWQEDRFFFVPKSTVFEILEFGVYVSEYYLKNESKPPHYQEPAWKEFRHDAVCIYPVNEKKTLNHYTDDYQLEFDSIQNEIATTEERKRDLRIRTEYAKQNIKDLENTFIQASKDVQWKWVCPGHTKKPQGKDRLHQLIYWCE